MRVPITVNNKGGFRPAFKIYTMKYILVFVLLISGVAYGQTRYYIRADSTVLEKVGGSNELVIKNDTKDSLGALVNIGGGKTAFQRGRASGDTLFLGRDTIIGIGAGGSAFTPAITPPQITSDEDNYNPTGLATAAVVRLDADDSGVPGSPRQITGLEGGVEGRTIVIYNIGINDIQFPEESGSSDPENGFVFSSSSARTFTLIPEQSVMMRYDGTTQRWRTVSFPTMDQIFAEEDYQVRLNRDARFVAAGVDFQVWDAQNILLDMQNRFQVSVADVPTSLVMESSGVEFDHVDSLYFANVGSLDVLTDLKILARDTNTNQLYSIPADLLGGGGSGITIGTTTVTSGTNTRVLFNNAGVAGEYTISGTGNVAMTTSPTFTTPIVNVGSDATGDIYYRSGGGVFTRLGVGTDGEVLTLVSGLPSWEAGGGGGANLSYDATNHEVDISGGGTSAVIPLAVDDGATEGLASFTAADFIITAGNVSIDYANGQAASASVNGFTTTGTQTFAGNKTYNGFITFAGSTLTGGSILASVGGSNGNFIFVGGLAVAAGTADAALLVQGASSTQYRGTFNGTTSTVLTANNNYGTLIMGSSAITEGTSGTHPLLASVIIKAPTITGGTATVTNTASLYIQGAPSATVTGVNTALYVAAGGVRLGGIGGAGMVQSDADGDLSVIAYTAPTTYTPTLTNTTNVAASTAYTTWYYRFGDMVHVWGEVSIDATTLGLGTRLNITLPVATSFTDPRDLAGTGAFENNTVVQIRANTATGGAEFIFTPVDASNNTYSFHFTYKYTTP